MAKSRVERNKYVNPPCTRASDRRAPTWSQLCPTNFITARTWLPGARDLRYRDGAASYHSRLTPGPLWLWKYSLLRTFLPLWFDPKVGTLQTVGLEKTETSRQIELCSLVSSRLRSWFGWHMEIWSRVSVCCSWRGQGKKRGEKEWSRE